MHTCLGAIRKEVRRAVEVLTAASSRYTMPAQFATCLEEIVWVNPALKPRFFEVKVLQRLGLEANGKTTDFPTKEQIARKFRSLRTKVRKETGSIE